MVIPHPGIKYEITYNGTLQGRLDWIFSKFNMVSYIHWEWVKEWADLPDIKQSFRFDNNEDRDHLGLIWQENKTDC